MEKDQAIKAATASYDALYQSLLDGIKEIQQEEQQPVKKFQRCMELCKQTLQQLKEIVLTHPFSRDVEEIYFFKHIKPRFHSQYIYFEELHNITLRQPTGNKTAVEDFLTVEYYRIKFNFDRNVDFYHYYRNEETYLDEQFFLRKKKIINKHLHCIYLDEDPVFSTGHDHMVARFKAYELLSEYINKTIDQLHTNEIPSIAPPNRKAALAWTSSKVALAEVIYAFYAAECFNGGTPDIKKLTDFICEAFNVKISNIYKAFEEIRIRKKNRTQFLDILKDALSRRMEDDDEHGN